MSVQGPCRFKDAQISLNKLIDWPLVPGTARSGGICGICQASKAKRKPDVLG